MNTKFILNDLLDAVERMAAIVAELNPGRTEDHRFIQFVIERASHELEETELPAHSVVNHDNMVHIEGPESAEPEKGATPMSIWCPKDDCQCALPECGEHGCMDVCDVCGGSGFSGRGSGYDDVCGECGGQKYFPRVVDTGDELHQILGEALNQTISDGKQP